MGMASVQVCSVEASAGQEAEEEKAACLANVARHGMLSTLVAAAVCSVWSWNTEGPMMQDTRREAFAAWEGLE